MSVSKKPNSSAHRQDRYGQIHLVLAIVGLIAPVLTFFLAVSPIVYEYKIAGLATTAAAYLAVCLWSYRSLRPGSRVKAEMSPVGDEIHNKLLVLEEANQFFGSSLKPDDLFKLVSNRVGEIFPFSTSVLFVMDAERVHYKTAYADGKNAPPFQNLEIAADRGIAGIAFLSGEVESDGELRMERTAMPGDALDGLRSAVAVPLIHDDEVFAVFQLYLDENVSLDESSSQLLEAIGKRVTPLFLGSLAFERSLSNALTDPLTNLPNERAFFMVLENQLAESQRFRDERPLTVLTIDVKAFSDANSNYGHSTGDRLLAFAAEGIKAQLRKMDFIARSQNDEFVIILPTATEKIANEIVERIKAYFGDNPFGISETDEIKVWLNFGTATFWKDGETAQQLIQNAHLRKAQAKAEEPSKVLWFPKEYVN